MSDYTRIWCLRHAESDNVVTGTAGRVPSAPLTARGLRQAAEAAERLSAEPIAAAYASDALRAVQTADPLAAPRSLEIVSDARLNEVSIGRHEGSQDPQIRRQTADVLRSWVVDGDLDRTVGDGESGHEVVSRMATAFQAIADAHRGGTVAAVGHVASLTVAMARLCGLGASVWGEPLAHAEPVLIEWEHTGRILR